MFGFFKKKHSKKKESNQENKHPNKANMPISQDNLPNLFGLKQNNPSMNHLPVNSFTINFAEIEKSMDELMKHMMNAEHMRKGKPMFIGISIEMQGNNPKIRFTTREDQREASNQANTEMLVDINDTGSKFFVVAQLPGVQKENIQINFLNENLIAIKATDGERIFYKEVSLPAEVEQKDAKISFNNSILEIALNKKKQAM